MKANDETTLKAFLLAIDRLDPPLAAEDYAKINQIGIAIAQQHFDQAIAIIHELTQSNPHLQERYDTARLDLKRQYKAQERSKSAIATLEKTGTDLEQDAILLLTRFSDRTRELFTDPSKRDSAKSDFWEKGDRIVTIIAGGAFLGGTIGQVPGAIIGSVLAAIYGWYTSSAKFRPDGMRR
ncbi:hypothetical protein [Leptolyngbya sp. NIES-2104]|uniref:hypothetical protein n=1 Tax=Leptolyngbya sp. NIES-2104 TaxID=1552121 RepID=UPI0006EC71ED|nr:hypothetical protein [Leptolyngbya sp. NIES-2104]GAP97760.1 hypothetical protein NIES2104_43080 [Leptolyngbya sp. NIES-2104]